MAAFRILEQRLPDGRHAVGWIRMSPGTGKDGDRSVRIFVADSRDRAIALFVNAENSEFDPLRAVQLLSSPAELPWR